MDTSSVLNKKILPEQGLTFDDVLLLPGYADFKRKDVDLTTRIHKTISLKLPVISSPMDTVTEDRMAQELAENGGMGIVHRNLNVEKQAAMVKKVKKSKVMNKETAAVDSKNRLIVGAAVGLGPDFEDRARALIESEIDVIVVDSGHGHTKFMADAVSYIKKTYPRAVIMAGNIATKKGAQALVKAGADILRIGMGPGSICTTRIVTGMGVPQLTAIIEAVKAVQKTNVTIVADGGIKQIGDMAKALAFGAHAVMLGSLLARFDESPGETVTVHGKKFKQYRGMGSVSAMKKGGAERYGQSKTTEEKKLIPEGVEGLVDYKGPVEDYLYQVAGSLKSSLYYIGAKNLSEFFEKSQFIKISNAGLRESHPHSIVVSETGSNYNI